MVNNPYIFSPQVVLTTLLVACSTSFVLNAYNFLFLKRFAIYVWFAIAPLIWVVCPLTGAAWVTKTYVKYKLVVVNAWVDIDEVCFGRLGTFYTKNSKEFHCAKPVMEHKLPLESTTEVTNWNFKRLKFLFVFICF